MSTMNQFDMCKFCQSNGEAEAQYRSHRLKNSCGLVTCPVLRSFVCPICKATGDFAHTQRYCPKNVDGRFNHGASLTELKKKKNAAGNFPSHKKMTWPISSYANVCSSYTGYLRPPPSSSCTPIHMRSSMSVTPPQHKMTMMPMDQMMTHHLTDPLPASHRPPSSPTLKQSNKAEQIAIHNHMQLINYYHNKQLYHEAEFTRMQTMREADRASPPPPCYSRSFPCLVTPPGSPQDRFIFPEIISGELRQCTTDLRPEAMGRKEEDLGDMLAGLRVGTVEIDM